jgi:hypothetical protein
MTEEINRQDAKGAKNRKRKNRVEKRGGSAFNCRAIMGFNLLFSLSFLGVLGVLAV